MTTHEQATAGAGREARGGRSSADSDAFLDRARASLGYALQPIVNIHTGAVYGYEALLRGVDELGFPDVYSLLDNAWRRGFACALDTLLRELAIGRFAQLQDPERYRLFFNLDPQLTELECPELTIELLRRHGLRPDSVCLELSERVDLTGNSAISEVIASYRRAHFQFAIDDFGAGYAGLRTLYEHPPDLLKIDRFFVHGIANDHRKRLFVANTVQLAHIMGIKVVAEGVETEEEFLACREVGCDMAQGYLVARPQLEAERLLTSYPQVGDINARDRRESRNDAALIEERLEVLPTLVVDASTETMFEVFRRHKNQTVIPLLDHAERPLGLIHEADIKEFIYSRYGRDLIANPAFARFLQDFAQPCPVVDIHDSAERLLAAFSASTNPAGLLVTQDGRYRGFISAASLLRLIDQKNLAMARDQNPLSKLPGNIPIHEYVSLALAEHHHTWYLIYLDFDSFKAFNDHYGFRLGDRAILMFSELLQKHLAGDHWFVGHVGGDDFFAGTRDTPRGQVIVTLQRLLARFRGDVQSLYDPQDRLRGYLRARDRFGQERDMPLMRCSAALLEIGPGDDYCSVESLGRVIAEMKHLAKSSPSGLVFRHDSDQRGSVLVVPEDWSPSDATPDWPHTSAPEPLLA